MADSKGTGLAVLAGALIAGAVIAAYHGTFSAPLVFDAAPIIAHNPSIWHLGTALLPPHDGSTVDGRPLVNLSFAVNYAISGTAVGSYHAVNLAIHILAAWVLYGIVRRTFRGEPARAAATALAVALLWALHPLQTESVTYLAQRAESLGGLCSLLTLYGFVRGAGEGRPRWLVFSLVACLAGTAAKEIIATAPLLVLLYDRTFLTGSFRAAWERHGTYYLALAATWIPLGCLVLGSAGRHGTAGFAVDLSWPAYALTQVHAVIHYLRLAIWPSPLVFDYGTAVQGPGKVAGAACLLLALAGATIAGLRARGMAGRTFGFLGAWFLVNLAPTSLIPVATQTVAEHRMYLPLAAVITAAVLVAGWVLVRPVALAILAILASFGLGAATAARNEVYGSELALWQDTAAKRPDNDRAHNNLGNALFFLGRVPEALAQYQEALRLRPRDNAEAEYNLGNAYLQEGRLAEALPRCAEAVRLAPGNPDARNNLGAALARSGRVTEALEQFRASARLDPDRAATHNNLGSAWLLLGRRAEAAAEYRQALRLDPGFADARAALDQLEGGSADSAARP